MNEDREHPMTGDRVAEVQERVETAEASRARSRANPSGTFDARMILDIQASQSDVPFLLAENAALRGRLAAVEALADRMTLPHKETGEPTGAHLLVAADMIRAVLATGETK